MNDWLVITVDRKVHFIGSHNRCYIWIITNIDPELQDSYYIVPSSLAEKFGIDWICEKMIEFYL